MDEWMQRRMRYDDDDQKSKIYSSLMSQCF